MPATPSKSDVDKQPHEPSDTQTLANETEFTNLITAMVANHAPRMFAIVIERAERLDAAITAWGLALDNSAYAITADGKNQYLLSAPEHALHYVRRTANTTPHPTSSGSIPPQPPHPNPPTNPRTRPSPAAQPPRHPPQLRLPTNPHHRKPMPTNCETVNAVAPPCPDCGVALTDPSVQHQPDYPPDGPLRKPTPYLRLAATAKEADAHIFDLPNDIHPELAAAIALRFDDHDQVHAIISLAADFDDDLRTDVLAYALAFYIADPLHIANQPDAILTISRTRLPPTTHGPGHLAWHLLHSCGRNVPSATFGLVSI